MLDPMFHALALLSAAGSIALKASATSSSPAWWRACSSSFPIVTGIISNLRAHHCKDHLFENGVGRCLRQSHALLLPMLGMELTFVGSVPYLILCIAVPFFLMYFAEPLSALCAGEKPEGSVGDILLNGFFEMFDTVLSFASNTMSFLRVGGFVLVHAGMMTVVFTLANMTGGVFY
ncbi:MAG: hypothetical protein ACLR7U_13215, partial [Ruthenibacterium lactatiformans]